jgi:hypothetical protein
MEGSLGGWLPGRKPGVGFGACSGDTVAMRPASLTILMFASSTLLAQDEASSVVWGMPGAVVKAGIADRVLPLSQLADEIALRARGMR